VKDRVINSGVGRDQRERRDARMATKMKAADNRIAIIGFHVVPKTPPRACRAEYIDGKRTA